MKTNPTSLPALHCACASIRRASRALTRHYDAALRPAGLRATQFTLLQAFSLAGETTQGDLGNLLALDSTTLTRTLRSLRARGWVAVRKGRDKRERWWRLSTAGLRELAAVTPLWKDSQQCLRNDLGARRWNELMSITNQLAAVAARDQEN